MFHKIRKCILTAALAVVVVTLVIIAITGMPLAVWSTLHWRLPIDTAWGVDMGGIVAQVLAVLGLFGILECSDNSSRVYA